jgi:hypothetical protein
MRHPFPPYPESPRVPRPWSRRGQDVASQRIDDAAGRFNERFLVMDFPATPPAQTLQQAIMSLGGPFVRILGIRGTLLESTVTPLGVELANLRIRVQLNGENDLITGGDPGPGSGFSSFATLFGDPASPWYWFAAPPRVRAGDTLTVTVFSQLFIGEGTPFLRTEFGVCVQDDDVYQELYARELESLEYDAGEYQGVDDPNKDEEPIWTRSR